MVHIKRLAVPKTWPIPRKETIFVARPLPGKKIELCMPLVMILKIIGYAKTTKECKTILNAGKVQVNGKVVKEIRYPVSLFDVVYITSIGKNFRVIFNKNKKLFFKEINDTESTITVSKIVNKTTLRGKKQQINLHDGRNILDGKYNVGVGDSIVIDFRENKIIETLKPEQGNFAYLISGKHLGNVGKIKNSKGKEIVLSVGNIEVLASKENVIVIGKDRPVISITQ